MERREFEFFAHQCTSSLSIVHEEKLLGAADDECQKDEREDGTKSRIRGLACGFVTSSEGEPGREEDPDAFGFKVEEPGERCDGESQRQRDKNRAKEQILRCCFVFIAS